MNKILIYSPYSEWYLHSYYDITVAHALIQRGSEVKIVCCDGIYSDCDVHWEAASPRNVDSCSSCMNVACKIYGNANLPFEWLSGFLTERDHKTAKHWVDSLPVKELKQAVFEEMPIAKWVVSSIHSHFRLANLDIGIKEIEKTFRSYLLGGVIAYLGAKKIFSEFKPTALFLFNGRFFSHRIFLELAKINDIRVLTHERGRLDNTISLNKNETVHSTKGVLESWLLWKDTPLAKKQIDEIENIFEDREKGKNTGWLSFVNSEKQEMNDFYKKFHIKEEKKLVILFTSSEDEIAASDHWKPLLDQHEWIKRVVNFFSDNKDYFLIIRLHPNHDHHTGSNTSFIDSVKSLQEEIKSDNILFFYPKDKVNSYQLIDASAVNLTFFSTITLECMFRCKPVLICGGGPYYGHNFIPYLLSEGKLEEQIGNLLVSDGVSQEKLREIYRFSYNIFVRMSYPFPLVKIVNVHHAKLNFNCTSELIPGKDKTLDSICNFLMFEKDILPKPIIIDKDAFLAEHELLIRKFFIVTSNKLALKYDNDDNKALISVVITCYNYGKYLKESVESVINQSYKNFELIIVNDGSTDNSKTVAENLMTHYKSCRIKLIDQKNSGQPAISRNNGIRIAKGEYIICLDADDKLDRDMLKKCVKLLESDKCYSIAYTDRLDFDGVDEIVTAGEYNFQFLKYANHISYCALFKREVWQKVGGYRLNVRGCEDWDFWVAAGALGYMGKRIPEPLFLYRRHDTGLYQQALKSFEERRNQIIVNNASAFSDVEVCNAKSKLDILMLEKNQTLSRSTDQRLVISVILPTYNRPLFFADALKSILSQTYQNIEVIVVNDCGENVDQILSNFSESVVAITYVRHGVNRGLSAARNTGLALARGEIICFLDDDDRFLPDHLETVVSEFCKQDVEFIYTNARYVHETVENGQRREIAHSEPYRGISYSREHLLVENFIPVNTWALRRNLALRAGTFDEKMTALEDWEFLLRLTALTDPLPINRTTVEVRMRQGVGQHMSHSERPHFLPLFRSVYERHSSESLEVQAGRKRRLAAFEREQSATVATKQSQSGYPNWRDRHRWSALAVARLAEQVAPLLESGAGVHLLMVAAAGENNALADTIDTLAAQGSASWRLTVFSPDPCPNSLFETESTLAWVQITAAEKLPSALNQAVALSPVHWFMVCSPGIRFEPPFVSLVLATSALHPDWRCIYFDEERINSDGQVTDPRLKPDANIELLRSSAYIGNAVLTHRALWPALNLHLAALPRAFAFDAALQAIESGGAAALGHIDELAVALPEAADGTSEEWALIAKPLLEGHLQRSGFIASVNDGYLPATFFVDYALTTHPLVSIIIPTKDRLDLLQPCVESLLEKTGYSTYEVIIVDNNSTDSATLDYLNHLLTRDERIKILRYAQNYNYSAINNFAARQANGEFLVLLNNDTVVLQENWLERMVAIGLCQEVGAVGCRLVYADQRVQHAGVIMGLSGIAEHIGIGSLINDSGYMGRAQLTQNLSAVTAACMLVRKDLFFEVGGLNEKDFSILYNDIDLCLKITERSYRIVWTPFVTLIHHGNSSLKQEHDANREKQNLHSQKAFIKKWGSRLGNDPAYHRRLSLRQRNWMIDGDFDTCWHPDLESLPRIVAQAPDEMGVGQYRVIGPIKELTQHEQICSFILPPLNSDKRFLPLVAELARAKPTVLFLQNAFSAFHLDDLQRYAELLPDIFRVFGQDDIVFAVPQKSAARKHFGKDTKAKVRRAVSCCHRVIATTEPIAEALRGMCNDIRVMPNYLERSRWGDLQLPRRERRKPRVGWAGAQQHGGDLEFILPVVEATANEVDWIFMGMCPPKLRYHVAEVHNAVPFDHYPATLAALDLDLAIAPLELNQFNTAKSNLRLLEYGAVGYPVIATDILPYQNAPVTRVPNNPKAWIEAIREHVHELDATHAAGEQLREWVLSQWMLDQHLDEWLRALLPG